MIALLLLLVVVVAATTIAAIVLYIMLAEARQRAEGAERKALIRSSEFVKSETKRIRADALRRSAAVVKGKVAEQFVPFTDDFDYNPRDCRFLGSPVDFVVFEGLSEGQLVRVVFIEVKSGKSSLSRRERQVRDVVDEGEVYWEEVSCGDKHQS